MLWSDCSDSLHPFPAGSLFVWQAVACPQTKFDRPHQGRSTVPRGIGLTAQTIDDLPYSPPSVSLNGIHERYLSSAKERSSSN